VNHIAGFQGFERLKHLRYEHQQVVKDCCPRLKDYQRDRPIAEVLLIRYVLVDRHQQFEARLFGSGQQPTIGETSEARVTASAAVVTAEGVAKPLVDTLVQKDAHLMAGEQRLFCFLESLRCHVPADGGKPLQKSLQAVSGFEILEQSAHQNSRASKRRGTGHNGGIANDDRLHALSVPQLPVCR
jgi:hypothetical protein